MNIQKVNDVYIMVDCEPGIARELYDKFTFEVPGAKFMPAYRSRQWDGKIRLFDLRNNQIYFGLNHYILDYCKENDLDYDIDKEIIHQNKIKDKDLENFIQSLKLKSNGKPIEMRDYQFNAVKHAIENHRGLFLSPTASGKSLIIYCLIRYYHLLTEKKILIIVPTTSLVEQLHSDFIDYGWKEKYLQKIYSGHTKEIEKDVIISTWQSIYKFDKDWFSHFDVIIGDEAHQFKAKSLTDIMTKLIDCKYRFGLTGTLDGTQTNQLVLEGTFGKVKKVTTTKELMDKKTVAQLKIKCLILKYDKVCCKEIKGKNYQEEVDYIVQYQKRNEFIINLAKHIKGNTLILFQFVEKHGQPLYDLAQTMITDRDIHFIYGGTKVSDRETIRSVVDNSKNSIMIASYGTLSTGVNIKNINNIIFASPSKSKVRVLQSIGRGLRTSEVKNSATLYDIADDISCKGKPNYTLNHFIHRVEYYNTEQFDYDMDTIVI